MVCPMKEQGGGRQERPTEYPYEPLYRPWSWALSSVSNIFLFAVLFGAIYAMYRQRKTKKKRVVGYRTVETKKTEVLEAQGKIRALVTGGSGHLGGEIVRQLIEDGGYRVYSLDLIIPDEELRNKDVYSYIQADIGDRDSLRLALRDIEVVFHTAAIVPWFVGYTAQDFHNVIANGTENIVAICKEHKVKRLIYTSSIATMLSSDSSQVIENLNESTPYPKQCRDAYGEAKMLAEKCVLGATRNNGMLTCVLRPFVIPDLRFVEKAAAYIDGGHNLSQISPVDTTARVHILAEKKLRSEDEASVIAGKPYIVVLDDIFTRRELAEFVATERFGTKPTGTPKWVVRLLAYFNVYTYNVTGKAPVGTLRVDMLDYGIKTHTFSSARGKKEIGWEDMRTWKDVFCQLIKEADESKKDK